MPEGCRIEGAGYTDAREQLERGDFFLPKKRCVKKKGA